MLYPDCMYFKKDNIVYYVVIDDEGQDKIMEIRRFLYDKQDSTINI